MAGEGEGGHLSSPGNVEKCFCANSLPTGHHQKRSLRFKFAKNVAFGGRTRWGAHSGPPVPLAGSGRETRREGEGKGGR